MQTETLTAIEIHTLTLQYHIEIIFSVLHSVNLVLKLECNYKYTFLKNYVFYFMDLPSYFLHAVSFFLG